jgi:hypothetical protein
MSEWLTVPMAAIMYRTGSYRATAGGCHEDHEAELPNLTHPAATLYTASPRNIRLGHVVSLSVGLRLAIPPIRQHCDASPNLIECRCDRSLAWASARLLAAIGRT